MLNALIRSICATIMFSLLAAPAVATPGLTATPATPKQIRTFHQAPMLAKEVAAGKLPPVAQRLPDKPLVVQPVHQIGVYGGTWRRMASYKGDISLTSRLGYETLMRWNRDGRSVIPDIAWKMEVKDNAKTFIFHLRPGMRWSDGHPFTSAAFRYQYHYVLKNKTLTPAPPNRLMVNGKLYTLTTPDPYTVIFHFASSYGIFPRVLCFIGRQQVIFAPGYYLKQFNAAFGHKDALNRIARAKGFTGWSAYYTDRADLNSNPDCPTIAAWKISIPFPATRSLAVRNPYYWKVDPAGNQLPYIDRISYDMVLNPAVLNFKAMNGAVDYQSRRINPGNYTLFMKSRKRHHYRVDVSYADAVTCVYLNQTSRDPVLRPLLRNRKFRVALSLAINRKEMNRFVYNGLAQITAGIVMPHDPFYDPALNKVPWLRYDPKRANELLDQIGLKRGPGGVRILPNGKPFRRILFVYPSEMGLNPQTWQLVADYWREIGLSCVVKLQSGPLSVLQVSNGNADFWCYTNVGLHWGVYPLWKVPLSPYSYFAPRFGRYFISKGKRGIKPTPEFQRLVNWYEQFTLTPSKKLRHELAAKILGQWSSECYVVPVYRAPVVTIISNRMHNVPQKILNSYTLMSPGYIGIEQFYLDKNQPPPPQRLWFQPTTEPKPYLYQPQDIFWRHRESAQTAPDATK